MTPIFPFSAVLGQERLKLALLLCAIDPAIGGVLVQGPRGVAKTTLARAFAELLPGRFVELPLGATEERVAGSLDLGKALGQGEVHFSPGLLARAHDGVLYVDEVNLLPDALVDLLLDAAATGTNVVERDGVSHVHPARFVLVGTMNPEEGELRPQLCDRFGLSVAADGLLEPQDRTQVVLRRLAYEGDPAAFVARYAAEQRELVERCRRARANVAALPFSGPGVAHAGRLCFQARVEGVRADLAMLRAARALAAWHERSEISAADVDAVAELALAHRRPPPGSGGTSGGSGPSGSGSSGSGSSGTSGAGAPRGGSGVMSGPPGGLPVASTAPASASSPGARQHTPSPDGWSPSSGALPPVPVRAVHVQHLPPALVPPPVRQRTPPARQRRQRGIGAVGTGSIDWVGTLAQLHRVAELGGVRRAPERDSVTLRRRPRRLARPATWVIAVDCSASMLRSGALARAKGIAHELAHRAARSSAQLRLVAFGGGGVHVATGSARAQQRFDAAITQLGASGGTPLAPALRRCFELCAARARQTPDSVQHRIFLLTDGRIAQPLDLPAAPPRTSLWVIDLELGPVRLGRAARIASALNAGYAHADSLGVRRSTE